MRQSLERNHCCSRHLPIIMIIIIIIIIMIISIIIIIIIFVVLPTFPLPEKPPQHIQSAVPETNRQKLRNGQFLEYILSLKFRL